MVMVRTFVALPERVSTMFNNPARWAFLALSVSDMDELFCVAAFMASILGVI
jgi:hypothetical protein